MQILFYLVFIILTIVNNLNINPLINKIFSFYFRE